MNSQNVYNLPLKCSMYFKTAQSFFFNGHARLQLFKLPEKLIQNAKLHFRLVFSVIQNVKLHFGLILKLHFRLIQNVTLGSRLGTGRRCRQQLPKLWHGLIDLQRKNLLFFYPESGLQSNLLANSQKENWALAIVSLVWGPSQCWSP